MLCLSENPPGKRAEVVGMSQGGTTGGEGEKLWEQKEPGMYLLPEGNRSWVL